MSTPSKEYRDYLQSLRWHVTREKALERSGNRCQRCPATKDLEVHHKHYKTLGHEQPDDLEVLCIRCHDMADLKRRRHNQREAAMNTFARKKYGDDWQSTVDPYDLSEEFGEWIESRDGF